MITGVVLCVLFYQLNMPSSYVTPAAPINILTTMKSMLDTSAARGDNAVKIPGMRTPKPKTSLPPYLSAAIPPKIFVSM